MSDIHSFYTPAVNALKEAGYYSDKGPKKIIILGDYLDRGREVKKMQAWLLQLIKNDEAILLRGNHEDLFENLVCKNHCFPQSIDMKHGVFQSALLLTDLEDEYKSILSSQQHSFGMDFQDKTSLFLRKLYSACIDTPFIKDILPSLKDYFETEHYIFVHGWLPCTYNKALNTYVPTVDYRKAYSFDWENARWINGMEAYRTYKFFKKTIVCGHYSASWGHCHINHKGSVFGPDGVYTPFSDEGILAIDSCTPRTHKVNCVVIND